jgi:hypothetical protein
MSFPISTKWGIEICYILFFENPKNFLKNMGILYFLPFLISHFFILMVTFNDYICFNKPVCSSPASGAGPPPYLMHIIYGCGFLSSLFSNEEPKETGKCIKLKLRLDNVERARIKLKVTFNALFLFL